MPAGIFNPTGNYVCIIVEKPLLNSSKAAKELLRKNLTILLAYVSESAAQQSVT